MRNRSHMNFCVECKRAFELKDNVDYCDRCRIILDISNGNYSGEPYDDQRYPEITRAIMSRYMEYGYDVK